MNRYLLIAIVAMAFASSSVLAASAKSYQVTGPVLAVSADTITVQKGSEKWEINKGSAAIPADVKAGSKVTIEYTMTATKLTAKDAKK